MANLTNIEREALNVICADCDELDGYGYSVAPSVIAALFKNFSQNGHVIGGVLTNLQKKGVLTIDDDTDRTHVWVFPEYFQQA